jgi:protocatechuate 3,4-dioxygenase beta subunit
LVVSGRVADSRARAVEGAEVAVVEQVWDDLGEQDVTLLAPSARTDAGGRFQFQVDPARQYDVFVMARKKGYACAWDGLNYGLNHKDRGLFLLVLEPACTLVGSIIDPDGKPVAVAEVQAVPVTSYLDRLRQRQILGPRDWFTTRTDAQGTFRFEHFAADVSATFRVRAPGQENVCIFRPQRQNACGYEVWRSDLRLMLAKTGAIKGRVQDHQGRPIGGVGLLLRAGRDAVNTYPSRPGRSDASGTFLFEGVLPGRHYLGLLSARGGTDRWVAEGIEVSVQASRVTDDAVMRVSEGGVVVVTARSAGTRRPVAGARVSVWRQTWGRSQPAVTDAQGTVRVRAPAGFLQMSVGAERFSAWNTTVDLAAGQTLSCEALLTPTPRVAGRVLDPAGRPVGDTAVTIHPFGDHVYTDGQGRFEGSVEPRRADAGQVIVARDPPRGLASVTRAQGFSRPVETRLGSAWVLTGRIVEPNGAPIPVARVSLGLDTSNCLSDLGVEVLTDRAGRFEMPAVPPVQAGFTYRLSVAAAGFGPKSYQRIAPSGPPGTVDLGAIELPLADESLSGVVVDANGAPAALVPIFVNPRAGVSQPPKSTATNEKGEFAFTRLCQGPIRLQASFSGEPGGAGYLSVEVPAREVKIILGQKSSHTSRVSLLGKPLPNWKDLIDLDSEPTKGQPILLCFFDLGQRSSRHCIDVLAGQTEALQRKGVIVAGIQAAATDEDTWKTWIKQRGGKLRFGRVGKDLKEVKSAWGVQSLPWLILADKNRIVRAEGFGVDELPSRITGLGNE